MFFVISGFLITAHLLRLSAVIGGVNVYRDTSHPTFTFMRTLAPYLYQRMVALDLLEPRTG
ncbi:MAG: hypothetical protein ABWX57_05865 [Aeromicrobium sp.]